MKLITISGLDGSGKSTQISLLKNYLESQGKRVFYFHTIQFSLANKLSSRGPTSTKASVTHANAFQIWLRKIFLHIDIWRFSLLRSKLRNNGYDYILSDRYFYDSVINIEYLESLKAKPSDIQGLRLQILAPDLAIYLKVSPEIIMSRKHVPDQGLEYLKKKNELYNNKISIWDMEVIDGNRDKDTVFEEIKKYVI